MHHILNSVLLQCDTGSFVQPHMAFFRSRCYKECFQQQDIFFNGITIYLSVTVMSPVWSQTTTRATPLRPTHPLCPAVLRPAIAARASCPPRRRRASLCRPPAHLALHGHPAAHPASRAQSSMTTLTFTLRPPRLPLADRSAPWSQPPYPPSLRPTASMSPSFSQSQS